MVAEVFRALGEPTRLELIQRLVREPKQQIGILTQGLDLTRQGARRHVQVLVDAKLIRLVPKGRDVWVELDPATLNGAKRFIEGLERDWDVRILALKRSIESEGWPG